jgi:hypothetical protein
MIIVVVPTDRPDISPVTYGTEDMGDVPSAALMEKATPKAIVPNPNSDTNIFLAIIFLLFTIYFLLSCPILALRRNFSSR